MKGDFTRDTFDRKKHYTSVRMQQGRVQLDADWNEQAQIQEYRRRTVSGDLIGISGGPQGKGADGKPLAGFKMVAETGRIRVTQGRYYVDGMLCENETDLLVLPQGSATPGIVAAKLPGAGIHLAYLDVWERHVTALEDPEMREVALGGPDTTTRVEIAWEIRIAENIVNAGTPASCEDFDTWQPPQGHSQGRLKARLNRGDTSGGPCESPGGEYHRLENQLYRVEIHRGGAFGQSTFKWSRDNGAVAARWTGNDGQDLTLDDAAPYQIQGLLNAKWVEITDELRERRGKRGILARVLTLEGNVLSIDPSSIDDPDDAGAHTIDRSKFGPIPLVRRWDSEGAQALAGPGGATQWIELEEDIEVRFDPDHGYRTGDYWLIPARTLIDNLLWPQTAAETPAFKPTDGVHHHYAPLALLSIAGNAVQVKDCRKLFPPVTAITADDVAFDGDACEMQDVETVQEALDTLCERRRNSCTLVALPGPGWESVFERIPKDGDAAICFQEGYYPISTITPVTVADKGHLKLSGVGPGTHIVAKQAEAALAFVGCKSVTVRDLFAEAQVAGSKDKRKHLNGVLSFAETPDVTIENVRVRCASAARRSAACITVQHLSAAESTGVRILHNEFKVGHQQTGILILNAGRVQIEDNVLAVAKKPRTLTLTRMLRDKFVRRAARLALASDIKVVDPSRLAFDPGSPPAPAPADAFEHAISGTNAAVSAGNFAVAFNAANTAVGNDLQTLIAASISETTGLYKSRDVVRHVKSLLDELLKYPDRLVETPGLADWFDRFRSQNPAIASQGIVIGGQHAYDVRILNNTIHGFLQGIHVGQSRPLRFRKPGVVDRTERLQIRGNTITVILHLLKLMERHGIFCGNCGSLVIEDNFIKIRRHEGTERTHVDGIRVFGEQGRFVKIRQNHIIDPIVGIYFNPLNKPIENLPKPLWLIADNIATGSHVREGVEIGDRKQKDETEATRKARERLNEKRRAKVRRAGNVP
ncbi:MAG: hypothetical protein JXB35_15830 [Anaerolineae bacterium]|nr:hypothetical protein [Anaerolineae bacterium]